MTDYSDITSDGGMDPRNKLDETMYRLTLAQRDAAWREVEAWKQRYEALSSCLTKTALMHANPAITLMAEPESFKAGKALTERQMLQLFTDPENQPSQFGTATLEHMEREIAAQREQIAQLVEVMGMQGYGTLAIAAAIRKGNP